MANGSEVEAKLPVWVALSDLFLDTELKDDDFRRIAETLKASGYPAVELRRIFADEVAPAFGPNLWSIAGEWAMWHENDVRDIVTRSNDGFAPFRALKRWMFRRYVAGKWARILPLLEP